MLVNSLVDKRQAAAQTIMMHKRAVHPTTLTLMTPKQLQARTKMTIKSRNGSPRANTNAQPIIVEK